MYPKGILDAIRNRDTGLARRLAKEHVEYVLAIRKAQLAEDLTNEGHTRSESTGAVSPG